MTSTSASPFAGHPATLHHARELERYTLRARDGDIGRIRDCYFDARTWDMRYLVVEAGDWPGARPVVISPEAFAAPIWADHVIPVGLTMDEVEDSPPLETDGPLPAQYESQLREHFGWPEYRDDPTRPSELHRMNAVMGARLRAVDGDIGHISGFLFDEVAWTIRFFVADTGNWLSGRRVLLAPAWVKAIDWPDRTLSVDVDREAVRQSPRYEADGIPASDYLADLHFHYRKPLPGFLTAQAI
jgi:hypothetical protein